MVPLEAFYHSFCFFLLQSLGAKGNALGRTLSIGIATNCMIHQGACGYPFYTSLPSFTLQSVPLLSPCIDDYVYRYMYTYT
jgi:hypothetical protein